MAKWLRISIENWWWGVGSATDISKLSDAWLDCNHDHAQGTRPTKFSHHLNAMIPSLGSVDEMAGRWAYLQLRPSAVHTPPSNPLTSVSSSLCRVDAVNGSIRYGYL